VPSHRVDGSIARLNGLENDHQRAKELHTRIEGLYPSWIASGRLSAGDEEELLSETGQLRRLYDDHIRIEEREVFPRAAELLDGQVIEAMSREFRACRE
jgi:hemerythrin superfamily protein